MEEKSPKRVWMIVEDEPSLRMMLSAAMMLIWGVEPLAFDDGYDAMAWLDGIEAQQASTLLPELALLDIRMPGPQGPEIAERLRKVPATSKIAIVMMTAYRLNTDERDSIMKMAKPQALVSKPLPVLSDLKQTLEKAIDSTRSGILNPIQVPPVPKGLQHEPDVSATPGPKESAAAPKGSQPGPGGLNIPSLKELTAAPKGAQPGPGVSGTPGPKESATAPKESQPGPGVSNIPSLKELTAAPKGAQQGTGVSGSPIPKELTAAPKGAQQGPGVSGAQGPRSSGQA